jgi:hypothetical protein
MRLEIVIELHTRNAFDKLSGLINDGTVLSNFARLVDEGLREVIVVRARKLV